ncbi:MAG TPA: VWA domain-containing protein [Vicinamibacteria bacterium]|nr:VWA domain-containing protein [Vicinamibacteria bacterium]
MNTRWPLAFTLAVLPLAAFSQAPPSGSPPEPTITLPPVAAELVQIDVVVTERNGAPVRGLGPEDFEVLEDGRRQRVTHFRDGRGRPLPVAADASAPAPTGPPPPARDEWPGRYVVLAVDDLHIQAANLVHAKRAFRRFAEEQVGEDDLVAVVTTSGALGNVHPFTRPGVALERAIDRLAPRAWPDATVGLIHMSAYQAELIERGDPDAKRLAVQEILQTQPASMESMAAAEAEAMARSIVAQTVHRAQATLGTLEDVVRSLAPLEGRKVMVLASDGFLVGLGTRSTQAYDLRKVVDAATRAGVVIYGLDTRGLVAFSSMDAASRFTPVMTAPGVRESVERQSEMAMRDAMHTLAEDTGGFLVASTNDLASGLRRIVADNDVYYVLAYEPANSARNGKFRKIEVRLPGRRGLRVRTRKGYFAPDDRKAPSVATLRAEAAKTAALRREADLHRGFSSLFPLREIPVALSADFVSLPPDGHQVVVSAVVDLGRVTFQTVGGRQQAVLEVAGVIHDEKGEEAANLQADTVSLSLGAERQRQVVQEGYRYRKVARLSPGLYQVRLVVREESTGRVGSASEWVEVPDLAGGKLALSGLFLGAEVPASGGAGVETEASPREVQALKRFRRSDTLYFQLFVYNAARDPAGATDVQVQAQVWAGPRMVASSPATPAAVGATEDAPAPHTSRFPLEGLAPGSYDLRVTVSDRRAGQNQLRRASFLVE